MGMRPVSPRENNCTGRARLQAEAGLEQNRPPESGGHAGGCSGAPPARSHSSASQEAPEPPAHVTKADARARPAAGSVPPSEPMRSHWSLITGERQETKQEERLSGQAHGQEDKATQGP